MKGKGVMQASINSPKIATLVGLVFAIGGLGGQAGCTSGRSPTAQSDQPTVVATSTILQDLAEQVGGEQFEIVGILQPGQDPHVYEPVPRDTQRLESADLVLYNGYNLEPGLIKLIRSTAKQQAFAVGEVVTPLTLNKEGRITQDPHVWGDARNGIKMAEAIRDRFIQLQPQYRTVLTQNTAKYVTLLQQTDRSIRQRIQTIPAANRKLVTTHDAFQYYARAYGLTVVGTLIGLSTEEQPSARTVQRLTNAVRNARVPTIFAETTLNPALIQTVATEAQVKLSPNRLFSDSLSAPGQDADTYVKMLNANTQSIVQGLGGQPTAKGLH
jgi:manganese/iron transport system substrate-binding protein